MVAREARLAATFVEVATNVDFLLESHGYLPTRAVTFSCAEATRRSAALRADSDVHAE